MSVTAFACGVCGAVSYNPNDAAKGYCGACKMWRDQPGQGYVVTVSDECPDCRRSLFYPSTPRLSIDALAGTAAVSYTLCPHGERPAELVPFNRGPAATGGD
jgi:hypothetical protein